MYVFRKKKCTSFLRIRTGYIRWPWWCHQMETSRYWALCEGNPPVTGGFPSQKTVARSFDFFFFFICAWTNGWENNRDTGDLRRYRAHYDVTLMICLCLSAIPNGLCHRLNHFINCEVVTEMNISAVAPRALVDGHAVLPLVRKKMTCGVGWNTHH